jgi:predicted transcriptional regulator
MGSLRQKIKQRLEKYLELDVNGIRNQILKVFMSLKKATVEMIHSIISKEYDVSQNVVASMIGYIHSKLGILRAHKESYKTPIEYSLNENYLDLVKSALNKSTAKDVDT